MLKLHYAPNSRAERVLWLLEELELPYELNSMPFHPEALKSEEHRKRHPLGRIPVINSTPENSPIKYSFPSKAVSIADKDLEAKRCACPRTVSSLLSGGRRMVWTTIVFIGCAIMPSQKWNHCK